MNFDLDDLSDGSNDSFFDDPKVSRRKSSIKSTPEKKAAVSDIFNLNEASSTKASDSKRSPSPQPKVKKPFKKISFDDDDDFLGNLGINKAKAPAEAPAKKKTNLLDSILAPSKDEKKGSNFDDILKDSLFKKAEISEPKKEEIIFPPPVAAEKSFISAETPKEGRRGRRGSTSGSLMDPLGLLGKEDIFDTKTKAPEATKPEVIAKSTAFSSDLPDWLGGSTPSINKPDPIPSQRSEKPQITESELYLPQKSQTNLSTTLEYPQTATTTASSEGTIFNTMLNQQKLSQSDADFQNSYLSLQQQESQLLMALQLKKYEENLTEIQKAQHEVLVKQEKQFNMLLDRHFAKQSLMENNMKLQQERINNHIQMLIMQTPSAKSLQTSEEGEEVEEREDVKFNKHISESLRERHREETFLMEESYKKQITLLEQQSEAIESRLKVEILALTEGFESRIESILKNNEAELQSYKDKLLKRQEDHLEEMRVLKNNHNAALEDLKSEHANQIENIKKMKNLEQDLFVNGQTYERKIEGSLEMLDANSKLLDNLQEKVHDKFNAVNLAKTQSIEVKEREIKRMQGYLEKCQEAAELERAQLLALIKSLETKIAEQNQNVREERFSMQQAVATFTARSLALEREAEFSRNSIERERDQLKTLKESLLAEQEKMLLQLTEEKLSIASEKSRLEISNKLHKDFESQKIKAESEAAIEIAKEATEQADKERTLMQHQQLENQRIRRLLKVQESELIGKIQEAEEMLQSSNQRYKEGEEAMKNAAKLEMKYTERAKELQTQMVSLSQREKKLAEDKMVLSKERLQLYTAMRQSKKCALCSNDGGKNGDFYGAEDAPKYMGDADAIRFRLEVLEDERNSEVSRED